MSYSRKAINFDLSTEALKKHFGENTAPAYNSVKQFMLTNGFEHRQYSGYTSIEPMSDIEVASLAEKLTHKFAWLSSCVQKFDATDIGEQHSLMHVLKNDTNPRLTTDLLNSQKFTQKQINDMREQAKKASKNIKLKDDKGKGRDLDR